MPYYLSNHDLCFIHIPKTGGSWVKRVLSQLQHGERDGSVTHGLPVRYSYQTMFCTVRDPAEWLASVWGHQVGLRWQEYPQNVPWKYFLLLLRDKDCQQNKLPLFIEAVTERIPGVVSWFYGNYIMPGVEIIKMPDEIYDYLSDLGANPYTLPPINVGKKPDLLTPELRQMVYVSEQATYEKYGFPAPELV